MPHSLRFCARLVAVLIVLASFANTQAPHPTIALAVDAREAPRCILHVRETISVRPGALNLRYAKWIPGEHGPTGPVTDVAGLQISANGKPVTWRRDLEDMYTIHATVPAGADNLDLIFDYLLPSQAQGFSSGASSTPALLDLSWNQVVIYPASPKPDEIQIAAALTLPAGWRYASALRGQKGAGDEIRFAPVSLTMLVDSPVMAGALVRSIDLTPPSGVPHTLNLASDNEAALAIPAERAAAYRRLVLEAQALFGGHHYDHYDFLLTLSDNVAHFGLEHHQSSDNRVGERALIDPSVRLSWYGELLPHEFAHSWNGKHRRPAGLATGDFSSPMGTDLLWVYEGLTQYLGKVLTARAGIWTADEYRQNVALLAATLDRQPGRAWRSLQDTNDAAQLLYAARHEWLSWRRGADFYDEGALIWLEADVTIRQLTGGRRSLDDFCKMFFGGTSGVPTVVPYSYQDLIQALNGIATYDWDGFFNTRVRQVARRAPLGGIEQGGWRLAFRDEPTGVELAREAAMKPTSFAFSLGFDVGQDATLLDVIPGTPAATAGLAPGMKIVAVNGRSYSKALLRDALRLGKTSRTPLDLLVVNGSFYRTYSIDYHGGERHPALERDPAKPDLLSVIVSPLTKKP